MIFFFCCFFTFAFGLAFGLDLWRMGSETWISLLNMTIFFCLGLGFVRNFVTGDFDF